MSPLSGIFSLLPLLYHKMHQYNTVYISFNDLCSTLECLAFLGNL